ncbi:hypothetical protein [Paenibacillus sp. A3M_27_13]|uniref:hypothetical protein n=1 Tax=Paenibacillus sp. A3M_27_13 TaxID=2962029 RepID=UPI000FB21C16|nr:hypothetical protein [Paenibacillus sp. A3M_27_13]MCP3744675.1 hypothetical protein [Paenibacillus sp. A3M_27_13]
METIRIGTAYEAPLAAYIGARLQDNGIPKLEVRLTLGASMVFGNNGISYDQQYIWLEELALEIISTGDVEDFSCIMINSSHINDQESIIKKWRTLQVKP